MAKGQHKSDKEQYGAYKAKSSRSVNRTAKLKRHLKKHPEDAQAQAALKTDGKQKEQPNQTGHYPARKDFIYDGAGRKIFIGSFQPNTKDAK